MQIHWKWKILWKLPHLSEPLFLERFSGPKIEFLVKIQKNTRTDNSMVINMWLGCKRSRSCQKPARFPASLAGDLKGNKDCSVSRQSCHLDCLHIMNPEVSRDCSSRKALPQKPLAGHCLKKFPVLEVPAPKTAWLLLEMTVSKWPGRIRRQGLSQEP